MNQSIEVAWYDFLVENNIATEEEINLVTDINGWKEETMTDILFARTGLRSYEQCVEDRCISSEELDNYYGINEEDDEDEDEEDDEE